jgi:D-amino-acid dehydrogenase
LFAIAEREGIDFDLERRGILHIYRDQKSFSRADRVNALLRHGGLERYAVTPEEIRTIEPALTGTFHGGFFTPSDATGDTHKFTRRLAAACEHRGMRFVGDAAVKRIAAGPDGIRLEWRTSEAKRCGARAGYFGRRCGDLRRRGEPQA